MSVSLRGSVAQRTCLNGDITIKEGAVVKRGSRLSGDVTLCKNSTVKRDTIISSGEVTIGRYSKLNGENYVVGDVDVGNFCAIAPRSAFWARNHDTSDWAMQHGFQTEIGTDWDVEESPVRIGSDVWVGLGAMVLSGVEVGHGACIGAHSVVTEDVEPYEVAGGNPAEHIRWRFDEEKRNRMLEEKWWERDVDEIEEMVSGPGGLLN